MPYAERMRTAIAKRMWAETHFRELERRLDEYAKQPRYIFENIQSESLGEVRFVEINQPPKEISFVIGDLINNRNRPIETAYRA